MSEIVAVKLKADETLKLALRPEQAADALSVSVPFLKEQIRSGKLKVVRKGRGARKAVLIPMSAIVAYLENSDADSDAEE
jgi:excisionase family DNA binding protein